MEAFVLLGVPLSKDFFKQFKNKICILNFPSFTLHYQINFSFERFLSYGNLIYKEEGRE
jgi:hypothetical protein